MYRGTNVTLSILALLIAAVAVFPAPVSATHGPTQTITMNTTLGADFTGHIVIATDGVTLDCAGHTITGAGSGIGIDLVGRSGVTVTDCHPTGFGFGFQLASSSGNTLIGNTAIGSFTGFALFVSSGNTFTGNTASGNINQGFFLFLSSGNTFTGNTASGNGQFGFNLGRSSGNILTGNTASGNGQDGFRVVFVGSVGNTITGNSILSNNHAIHICQTLMGQNTLFPNQVRGRAVFVDRLC